MLAIQIIKRPMMSEKNAFQMESNTFVFEVDRAATKIMVRKAVEELFSVKVTDVRTAVGRGRSKKTKYGVSKPKYYKKAFVQLAEGEKIALFEGA